jgi:hypothetical protein
MLDGLRLQEVLFELRLTMLAKLLIGDIVTVEEPGELTFTLTLRGLAVIVKSWTTNVTVTECDSAPFVPVTRTCLLPVDVNEQDTVDVPVPVTLDGETLQDEVVLVARFTMPANPLTALIVMFEMPAVFTLTLRLVGPAVIVKSCTSNVTMTE